LRERGLYWRAEDSLATTEFTYSRFLTPSLAGYQGWALYFDCDFLFLADIAVLVEYTIPLKAVYCVQHDYKPRESIKMDGKVQTAYPRKNWSSLMLFNCEHPAVKALTPDLVNRETGAYLHRMRWVKDEDIGVLPATWNWLEGWNEKPAMGTPNVVHFTRGGPWFVQRQNVDYADLWLKERDALQRASSSAA
jgi:lipopolysaccharide biosynthesis glycosyltransferase